ncbi:hypothetical protein NI454_08770 [Brevundimonas diminuta]|uniref:hypothetical protein n=1 Tax=Brevundimonas diminuta TaxID=293 RepID=UPI002096829A|nr:MULTISPECIES: hypothetical protein [Brevundimonas]MCO8030047.1 hypothetical protein [Brevundimonas diminuta]
MRQSLIYVAAAALTLAACNQPETTPPAETAAPVEIAPAPTDAAPTATADWSALNAQVGKYPNETKLLEDSPITADLKTLVGAKFDVLATNMQTQAPLQKDGAVLFTSGNKQHEGGVNAAYLLIDPATRALEVGLWEGGKLTTYKTPGSNLAKPKDVETMIANAAG